MGRGPIVEQVRKQFDDTEGGGIFDPPESQYQLNAALSGNADESNPYSDTLAGDIGRQFDDKPGGGVADQAADRALNLGPDWLDEAVIIGLVTVVIGVLLFLARPLLTIIAGVTD